MPPGPPSRADPLEQARPARVSKAQPCWQAAGCWCLAGGAMPLFGGRPELASSHRAHGRLMQLLSNSQTRIRGERGRRCGGLWAAAPHIGLGGPSSFRGSPISPCQPRAPRHGPKVKAGSAESTEVWKNGWVCRSGWKTPQIWGGGMLLPAGKGPPNPKSGAPSSVWSPFRDITPGLQRILRGTRCPAMPTLPHHPHPRHLHPHHSHPHPPSGPSPK